MKTQDVIQGISDGVFSFLNDRPVSVIDPAIKEISAAVAIAVNAWMDTHQDEIIDAIARRHKIE